MRDARRVTRETFGPFDAVASLGAFEHFCSPEDYWAGRQEDVYREMFANTATTLPEGSRQIAPCISCARERSVDSS